jgi:hypothetical protein
VNSSFANGDITQSGALSVLNGLSTFNAGAGNVVLTNALNDLGDSGAVSFTAGNAYLTDVDELLLGASTVTGDMEIFTQGDITQNGPLNIGDWLRITSYSAVTLDNAGNTIGTLKVVADSATVVESGALSAQQVNQYLTQEQVAKARVDSAKAQLDAQVLRLKHTQVLAPDNGIISARSATLGAVAGAGSELFKLIRHGRLEWRAEVTAPEMGRISAGMHVLLTAPGGVQRQGRVRVVAPTVDPETRNGLVFVDVLGPVGTSAVGAFKPGMYVRGEFEMGSSSALTVPQTAVVVRDGFSYT